jgi:hypothetical protein
MTDELRREVEKLVGRNLAPAEGQDPHAPKKSPEEPAQTENPIESAAAERLSTHCELPADSHIETSAPAREDEPHPSASFCSTTEVSVAVQHQLEKAVEVNVIAKKRHGRALPE